MSKVLKHKMTYDDALRYFEYKDGLLYWKESTSKRAKVGKIAGYKNWCGYYVVSLHGVKYRAHRIIWLLAHGYWPENYIDHIDGNTGNNSIENLREVSQQCNLRNCKVSKNNTSGVSGVSFNKTLGYWTASIKNMYVDDHLGYFKTKIDAVKARYNAELKHGWPVCAKTSSALAYLIEHGEVAA